MCNCFVKKKIFQEWINAYVINVRKFFACISTVQCNSYRSWKWQKKSFWGKVTTAPVFRHFEEVSPYGRGGQTEATTGSHPTPAQPRILSTKLYAQTLVLCEGKEEEDRKGGGEETWLGNLNGTTLSHCMGGWAELQDFTDTALK